MYRSVSGQELHCTHVCRLLWLPFPQMHVLRRSCCFGRPRTWELFFPSITSSADTPTTQTMQNRDPATGGCTRTGGVFWLLGLVNAGLSIYNAVNSKSRNLASTGDLVLAVSGESAAAGMLQSSWRVAASEIGQQWIELPVMLLVEGIEAGDDAMVTAATQVLRFICHHHDGLDLLHDIPADCGDK